MAIEPKNLVIYGAQRQTDTEDGGGQYNGVIIQDGQSNNLFDDVSELDRTMGNVSMRKIFPAVNTSDTDKLMGGVAFIAQNPNDSAVSASLFSTADWTDKRSSAQNRVENYLAKGGQGTGTLLDTAYKGMKQFQTASFTSEDSYNTGTTLVLVQNEGKANEQSQFVRITAVSTRTAKMVIDQKEVEYKLTTYSVSEALLFDFTGLSAKAWYANNTVSTILRETIVADTGKYYASTELNENINIGQTTVNAKTIYIQLIPSAQSETPLIDVSAASEDTVLIAANSQSIIVNKTVTIDPTQNCYLGSAILPNSLNFSLFGTQMSDKGGDILNNLGTSVGTVDYANGIIKWSTTAGYGSTNINFSFIPAAAPTRSQETLLMTVTAENRGSNWTRTLAPIPSAGSLKVSYVSQGKVYTLRDSGNGVLKGTSALFGSGTINYETGTVLLTCGSLPDVNSGILFTWGQNLHLYSRADMPISKAYVPIAFDANVIVPGSLTVTWKYGADTKTATDDGQGNFKGDATGSIDYGNSTAKLMPNVLPMGSTDFNVSYDKGIKKSVTLNGTVGSEILIDGSGTLKAGSIALAVSFQGLNNVGNGSASGVLRTMNFYDQKIDDTKGQLIHRDTGKVQGTIKYVDRTITLNPSVNYAYEETKYAQAIDAGSIAYTYKTTRTDTPLNNALAIVCNYRDSSDAFTASSTITATELRVDLTDGYAETILSESLRFLLGGAMYIDRAGLLYRDPLVTNGSATYAGTLQYSGGLIKVTSWNSGASNDVALQALVTTMDQLTVSRIAFRSAVMPLQVDSVTIRATRIDGGGTITIQPPANGVVNTATVSGAFNWDYGLGQFSFREKTEITTANRAEIEAYPWYNVSFEYTDGGKTYIDKPIYVLSDSIKYNAVGYSSIPLDASILGLSATRLPTDGRVPIFRVGDVAVLSSSKSYTLPDTVAGKTYSLDDQRISFCELEDANGVKLDASLYVVDYDYGKFVLSGDFALNNLKTPLYAKYRYQDMGLISDVQIDGQITLTKPITHRYSTVDSIVGSGLVIGDMYARYTNKFTDSTWNSVFNSVATGSSISANYNDALYPIQVTNKGAIQERWALVFTSTTGFRVIGEYSGQIATGSIDSDCAPINPVTNAPYFVIKATGWGTGWASGNVLRFDTKAATYPIWCIRTVKQSEPSLLSDQFQLMLRGDIDRKL
ncbi:hypothetical protein [Acinetobacter nectaris]|uniref:hypothetical protein n=1 Tax=Acinetobacter nectaris TaxID=1219382 RepID=UPI001F432608|nr:hypothetical protein [Acinetobacter nectaris]MCF9045965.1 hypothetical protein [Acinetobacter nectaris]